MNTTLQLRVLIMGLPGSGKTTLARLVNMKLPNSVMINADVERERANDWDFSDEGRIRQAKRMKGLADASSAKIVIADFVAGTTAQRDIFRPHVLVWMNTIKAGRYADTNAAFKDPIIVSVRFDSFLEINLQKVVDVICKTCNNQNYCGDRCNVIKEHFGVNDAEIS